MLVSAAKKCGLAIGIKIPHSYIEPTVKETWFNIKRVIYSYTYKLSDQTSLRNQLLDRHIP